MACFIKSGPGSSERADPGTKIHFIGSRFIFHKFEGSDFKYDSRFLKLLSKNTQARHFWYQFQAFFVLFFSKFCIQINSRMLISNMTIVLLKFQPKNTQIRHFSSQIQEFWFCTKLCTQTNSRALVTNMTMNFSNSSLKIPK